MSVSTITRRRLLASSGALVASSFVPRVGHAMYRDPRLLTVVLRGGLDGLSVVAPVGDPDYETIREGLAFGDENAGIRLDGFYALNGNMPSLAGLYKKREALIVHATATPYRERSHFDGQDVLESGLATSTKGESGWMNRALGAMERRGRVNASGFAVGAQVPLIMRGPAPVLSWMPPGFEQASADTRRRLLNIYRHADPTLARAVESGMELDEMIGGEDEIRTVMRTSREMGGRGNVRQYRMFGSVAGKVMADPDGPRLGSFDLGGWDTHANARPFKGNLGKRLRALDATIEGLNMQLAEVWKDTVIVLVTEFGRTVRMNGTGGTDHGTATIALLIGGAVRGGRVIADWPGLSERVQYQKRDLMPTVDLRSVFKGVLGDHLDVPKRRLADTVFPDSQSVKPLNGLIA